MATTLNPVDRAVADLEKQIKALEQQARQLEQPVTVPAKPPPARNWLRDFLQPPSRTPALRPRRDLFDVPVNAVKTLEAETVPLHSREPDLFQPRDPAQKEKLAHYLNAGTLGAQKPLRHVQRRNQRQFIVWLSLSVVAVVILWIVVR